MKPNDSPLVDGSKWFEGKHHAEFDRVPPTSGLQSQRARLSRRLSRRRSQSLPGLRPHPLDHRPCFGRMRFLLNGSPAERSADARAGGFARILERHATKLRRTQRRLSSRFLIFARCARVYIRAHEATRPPGRPDRIGIPCACRRRGELHASERHRSSHGRLVDPSRWNAGLEAPWFGSVRGRSRDDDIQRSRLRVRYSSDGRRCGSDHMGRSQSLRREIRNSEP